MGCEMRATSWNQVVRIWKEVAVFGLDNTDWMPLIFLLGIRLEDALIGCHHKSGSHIVERGDKLCWIPWMKGWRVCVIFDIYILFGSKRISGGRVIELGLRWVLRYNLTWYLPKGFMSSVRTPVLVIWIEDFYWLYWFPEGQTVFLGILFKSCWIAIWLYSWYFRSKRWL